MLNLILGALAVLSLGLLLWQFAVCMRFPLHRRIANPAFAPDISVLKPLKGADAETRGCLESWFTQQYGGRVQILFGVHAPDDPVCDIVRQLIASHPGIDAQLVVCPKMLGANAKVSTLVQLQREAKYAVIAVSDADVWVPGDFLNQCAAPLANNSVALVNCFYRLTNQRTLAMRCEAFAVNGDFWGQVLQARSLKPLDFALGAVMLTSQSSLKKIGAFESLLDHLADDYQLGNRLARSGGQIVISPVVVECRSETSRALHVWQHQLRWARTIRVSQPVPFFFQHPQRRTSLGVPVGDLLPNGALPNGSRGLRGGPVDDRNPDGAAADRANRFFVSRRRHDLRLFASRGLGAVVPGERGRMARCEVPRRARRQTPQVRLKPAITRLIDSAAKTFSAEPRSKPD